MSYDASASSDRLTGTFGSAKSQPITLAVWVKKADWPATDGYAIQLNEDFGSGNNSLGINNNTTADAATARARDTATSTATQSFSAGSLDNVWTPLVAVFESGTARRIYIGSSAVTASNATSRTIPALDDLTVGNAFSGFAPLLGLVAEPAVWNKALTTDEIDDYCLGLRATHIAAENLVGYWPLAVDQSSHADQSGNGGPTLAVQSDIPFSSDHPTISDGDAEAEFVGTPSVTPTTDGYTIDFEITGDDGTVSAVAVLKGQTAPTATQVHAGTDTNDDPAIATDAIEALADDPDQLELVVNFPEHDLYVAVGTEVVTLTSQRKLPPTGYQYVTIDVPWSMGEESILQDASPAAVDGDIIECSAVTSPGGYAITCGADGVVSFNPGIDTERQDWLARFYDVSVGDWSDDPAVPFYEGNQLPGLEFDPTIVAYKNVPFSLDLRTRWQDSEGDAIVVTFQDSLPAGLSVTASELSGTPSEASAAADYTERATDITGDYAENETSITVIDTEEMPDVDDGDVTEAAAISAISGAGLQSPSVSYGVSESVTVGNVISQAPPAGTTHPVSAATAIVVSAAAGDARWRRCGFGFGF